MPHAKRWLALAALWSVPGLIELSEHYLLGAVKGFPVSLGEAILANFLHWQVWVPATIAIVWLWQHLPVRRPRWVLALVVHLAANLAIAVADVSASYGLGTLAGIQWTTNFSALQLVLVSVIRGALMYLVLYWGVIAIHEGLEVRRRYREAELAQAQLQARLAQAHLDALKAQLRPHFLFNTLNAIAVLVRKRDDVAAVKMIVGLGDLLRRSLVSMRVEYGTLREELDFLRRYVDIATTRFADRLRVSIVADEATLQARIPNLILQPLVENALEHGLAPLPAGGAIEIRAEIVDDDRLRVIVRDDGVGLRPSAAREGEGLGLSHVRRRLEELYGDRHHFSLEAGESAGAVATLEIPFERQEPA